MEVLRWPTEALLATAPPDWQVLQLYSLGGLASRLYSDPGAALWEPWHLKKRLYNTGAYVINRAGMRQVRCGHKNTDIGSGGQGGTCSVRWEPLPLYNPSLNPNLCTPDTHTDDVAHVVTCDATDAMESAHVHTDAAMPSLGRFTQCLRTVHRLCVRVLWSGRSSL